MDALKASVDAAKDSGTKSKKKPTRRKTAKRSAA